MFECATLHPCSKQYRYCKQPKGVSIMAKRNKTEAAAASTTEGAVVAVMPIAKGAALHPSQQTVTLGKPYNVRAGTQFDNVASWQATCAFIAGKGGSCTVAELAAHLKEIRNHANFAGYCVRRGYLVPVQPVAATVASQPAA